MCVIYTLPNCPNCIEAKNTLFEKGIEFQEKNMFDPEAMTELNIAGIFPLSAPVVFLDNKYLNYKLKQYVWA
jgi:glutaredoxin 3